MNEKNNPNSKTGTSFSFFIATLGMQISIFLGDTPNPATGTKTSNHKQAQLLIDTLRMLKDKTKNNLDKDEQETLDKILERFCPRYNEPGSSAGNA